MGPHNFPVLMHSLLGYFWEAVKNVLCISSSMTATENTLDTLGAEKCSLSPERTPDLNHMTRSIDSYHNVGSADEFSPVPARFAIHCCQAVSMSMSILSDIYKDHTTTLYIELDYKCLVPINTFRKYRDK